MRSLNQSVKVPLARVFSQEKLTGDYVAIKVEKSDMIAKNQVTNVSECNHDIQCDSEHVVQLIASFQSTIICIWLWNI